MRFGDLLRDIRNPNLSRQRLEDIVRAFNELGDREDRYNAFINQKSKIRIEDIAGYPFLGTVGIARLASQSIPNNIETVVDFDDLDTGTAVFPDPSDWSIIRRPSGSPFTTLGIIGTVQWAANGVGRRALVVNVYDGGGVQQHGQTFHSRLPTNILADTIPFAGAIVTNAQTAYIQVAVYQNSGGALNLENCRAYIFEMLT